MSNAADRRSSDEWFFPALDGSGEVEPAPLSASVFARESEFRGYTQETVADPDQHTGKHSHCPVGRCAEILSGKWTLLVIRDLLDGPRHYGELERSLRGISPRTLCDRLKFLAEQDVVTRTYIKGLPPRTVYELTDRGRALESVISVMRAYGDEWLVHVSAETKRAAVQTGAHGTAAQH